MRLLDSGRFHSAAAVGSKWKGVLGLLLHDGHTTMPDRGCGPNNEAGQANAMVGRLEGMLGERKGARRLMQTQRRTASVSVAISTLAPSSQ